MRIFYKLCQSENILNIALSNLFVIAYQCADD